MLLVEIEEGAIVVREPMADFAAVYYKPASEPQLILRRRTVERLWSQGEFEFERRVRTWEE